MDIKAKVIFDQKVLMGEVNKVTYNELSQLEAGDAESIYLQGVRIFGEKRYTTLEDGVVHRMYIYMKNVKEDVPSFLRGKKHRVEVDPIEFVKNLGINLRLFSTSNASSGWMASEFTLTADEWTTARIIIDMIDQLNNLRNCESCGRPLVDPTGKLVTDTRVTKCLWHCENSSPLAGNEAILPALS